MLKKLISTWTKGPDFWQCPHYQLLLWQVKALKLYFLALADIDNDDVDFGNDIFFIFQKNKRYFNFAKNSFFRSCVCVRKQRIYT